MMADMCGRRQYVFHWGTAVFFLYALFYPGASFGKDWPQYRGANHDGISTDRIIKQWTGAVTNPLWRIYLSNGISSMTVSGGRAYTQVARTAAALGTNLEYCVALNITNGAELWATPVDFANYPNAGVGSDDGPRSTPTLDSGSVFVLSSNLKLLRLNATNGSVIWSNNLTARYGGSVISWQSAASPVLEGDLLFVNANASPSRLMAFHASDGSLAWRSQNESSYFCHTSRFSVGGAHYWEFALEVSLSIYLWHFSGCLARGLQ
jgi:hypothetical protein